MANLAYPNLPAGDTYTKQQVKDIVSKWQPGIDPMGYEKINPGILNAWQSYFPGSQNISGSQFIGEQQAPAPMSGTYIPPAPTPNEVIRDTSGKYLVNPSTSNNTNNQNMPIQTTIPPTNSAAKTAASMNVAYPTSALNLNPNFLSNYNPGLGPILQPNATMFGLKTTTPTSGTSIVDYLKSIGQANDFASRTNLAKQYGIVNYTGTAQQNTQLLNILKGGTGETTGQTLGASQNSTQITDLQKQIADTMAQITAKQAQLNAMSPTPITPTSTTPTGGTGSTDTTTTGGGGGATSTNPYQASAVQDMAQNNTLLSQLISNMMNLRNSPDVESAYNTVTNLESGLQAGGNKIMATPIPLEFQQGQMAALQRDYGPQLTAAQNILGKALTGQQQQLAGLQAAAGLAQPVQLPYTSQYISPLTGQPVAGGAIGGAAMDVVNNLAQQIANGKSGMDYATGMSQLSGYGPAIQNQLLPAIQRINPNFNINQSIASAGAQTSNITQAGQIQAQQGDLDASITALTNAIDLLSPLEKTPAPGFNALIMGGSNITGIGSKNLNDYRTALARVRSVAAKMLGVSDSEVNAFLPDNPYTLPTNLQLVQTMIKNKISSLNAPATVSPNISNQTSGGYGW